MSVFLLFSFLMSFGHAESVCVEPQGSALVKIIKGKKERVRGGSYLLKKITRLKKSKRKVYVINYQGRTAVLLGKNVSLTKDGDCTEPSLDTPMTMSQKAPRKKRKSSGIGFELGYGLGFDSSYIEGLLFERFRYPLPANDANSEFFDAPFNTISVPDPFIDSIDDGTGFALYGFYEHSLFGRFRLKWGAGYWQRDFNLETYPIPGTAFQNVLFLTPVEQTVSFSALSFRPELRWVYYDGVHWDWSFGVALLVDYLLEEQTFEYRIGTNDTQAVIVRAGPEQLSMRYMVRVLEVQYGSLRVSVDLQSPHEETSPILSVGYLL